MKTLSKIFIALFLLASIHAFAQLTTKKIKSHNPKTSTTSCVVAPTYTFVPPTSPPIPNPNWGTYDIKLLISGANCTLPTDTFKLTFNLPAPPVNGVASPNQILLNGSWMGTGNYSSSTDFTQETMTLGTLTPPPANNVFTAGDVIDVIFGIGLNNMPDPSTLKISNIQVAGTAPPAPGGINISLGAAPSGYPNPSGTLSVLIADKSNNQTSNATPSWDNPNNPVANLFANNTYTVSAGTVTTSSGQICSPSIQNPTVVATATTPYPTTTITYSQPCQTPPPSKPLVMGYWGNWHVYDQKNQYPGADNRPLNYYEIPGSILFNNAGTIVSNPPFVAQMNNLNAVAYAFFEIYPDPAMGTNSNNVTTQFGSLMFSDPWSDLSTNNVTYPGSTNGFNNNAMCADPNNFYLCFGAYLLKGTQDLPKSGNPLVPGKPPADVYNFLFMGQFNTFLQIPNIKHVISIGGWTHQGGFQQGAFVQPQVFANSVVSFLNYVKNTYKSSIDGIDLDYEPPTNYGPTDGNNMFILVSTLRNALDTAGYSTVFISMPVFANTSRMDMFGLPNYAKLSGIHDFYFGIMGYDFHGNFDTAALFKPSGLKAALQSNLYKVPNDPTVAPGPFNVDGAIQYLIKGGVNPQKIIMGVPAYGRVVNNVATTPATNGLFNAFTNPTPPALPPNYDFGNGDISYYSIVNTWLKGTPGGFTQYTISDPTTNQVSGAWAFNGKDTFTSYDSPTVIQSKVNYVKQNNLGGMMLFELVGDVDPTADPNHAAVLTAIWQGMNPSSKNKNTDTSAAAQKKKK